MGWFNHQLGRLSDQEILLLMLQKWTKQPSNKKTFGSYQNCVKKCNKNYPPGMFNISPFLQGTFEPMIFPFFPGGDMLFSVNGPNNHLIQPSFGMISKALVKNAIKKTTFPSDLPSLKFNIAPENRESQKETHLPTIHFQGLC